MGHQASGKWIQVGSTFLGISETITIGHILYDNDFSIVPMNDLGILARMDPGHIPVFPIGDIHIFTGETECTATMKSN
jgi:hypothetical protein